MADEFHQRFHYIGGSRSPVNYGVVHGNTIIACASFKKPTRQSKYGWELIRMTSDPSYSVPGAWSKIMGAFIVEHRPKSVVSFSDNRLFSGGVYERIGFTLDGIVSPDYYWVKGNKRHHKSSMRKRPHERELGTETQLREAEGYRKIWDLGKKRWVRVIERT